jgi:hypothetical protein
MSNLILIGEEIYKGRPRKSPIRMRPCIAYTNTNIIANQIAIEHYYALSLQVRIQAYSMHAMKTHLYA